MEKTNIKELLNKITLKRFVNLHFNGYQQDTEKVNEIIREIEQELGKTDLIEINIEPFPNKEKRMIQTLLNIINETLTKKQSNHWLNEAISITSVLHKLNERLERPALIIFYQLKHPDIKRNRNAKKEKILLTSIRKFIQMKESHLLGILVISSHKTEKWNLSPYSNLDERYIEYFQFPETNKNIG